MAIILVLLFWLVAPARGQQVQVIQVHVDPATKISPEIGVSVTCHAGHTYYYTYTLRSLPISEQMIGAIWLRTRAPDVAQSAPPGWGSGVSFLPDGGTEFSWIAAREEGYFLLRFNIELILDGLGG